MLLLLDSIDEQILFRKLLKYGFFPENLTSIFSSKKFGVWAIKHGIETHKDSYFSSIKYRLTRNNNAPRILDIPHPIAYFRFCNELKINWSLIKGKIGEVEDYESRSMIRPKPNNLNERLLSMKSYNREDNENLLLLDKSLGKKFYVHADITNCYPSIYTHSIAWALVGHLEAKKNSKDHKLWYNRLDAYLRFMQRNETAGICIGPDTSGIVSELILSQIDKALVEFNYLRYIDDFKCYCESREKADEFIRRLSRELERYHLRLNSKKTIIKELPLQYNEDWVNRLNEYCSNFLSKKKYSIKELSKITAFIDLAINLSKTNPGESPIKYAVKILSKKIYDEQLLKFTILYLFRICYIYPYFIDVIVDLLERNRKSITVDLIEILKVEATTVLNEHIKYSRSDVILWCLILSLKFNFKFDDFESMSNRIIEERECLPALLCFQYAKRNSISTSKYYKLINTLIDEKTEDEWWLYIYELFRLKPKSHYVKKIQYKEFYSKLQKDRITFFKLRSHHKASARRVKMYRSIV